MTLIVISAMICLVFSVSPSSGLTNDRVGRASLGGPTPCPHLFSIFSLVWWWDNSAHWDFCILVSEPRNRITNFNAQSYQAPYVITELGFAPYSLAYDNLDTDYKISGLNREINNWAAVDDFNWLVNDTQSPNWYQLPVEGHREFSIK